MTARLREQVVSLTETHIFSPAVVNRATFGFSRGAFFFDSGTTVSLPGWIHADQPVGALVVGGGTTLNGASQITNGGTNAGSNLTAVRNLFTLHIPIVGPADIQTWRSRTQPSATRNMYLTTSKGLEMLW